MNSKSLIWGLVGTAVWLLIILLFAVLNGYELPNSLNELGDALAGIVAPIAFFWLILGYLQQSKQLEQNSIAINQQAEALNLQIAEMKESVKQQTELAEIQKQQFRAMLNAATNKIEIVSYKLRGEPKYNLINQNVEYTYIFQFILKAHVNELRNLKVLRNETSTHKIDNLGVGESEDIQIFIFPESECDEKLDKFLRKEIAKYEFSLTISYQTIYGEEKREDFFYDFVEEKGEILAKKPLWERLGGKSPQS